MLDAAGAGNTAVDADELAILGIMTGTNIGAGVTTDDIVSGL